MPCIYPPKKPTSSPPVLIKDFKSPRYRTNRTHVSRTPKNPEYLIARSQLTYYGVRWDSVPTSIFDGKRFWEITEINHLSHDCIGFGPVNLVDPIPITFRSTKRRVIAGEVSLLGRPGTEVIGSIVNGSMGYFTYFLYGIFLGET